MPTTYAHDLFGKEVYKRLPADMKASTRLWHLSGRRQKIKTCLQSRRLFTLSQSFGEAFFRGWGRSAEVMMKNFSHIFWDLDVTICWTQPAIPM